MRKTAKPDGKEGGYVRVSDSTKAAINILSGEMQIQTGRKVTADEALWAIINQARPDLAEKVEQVASITQELESEDA